MSAPSSGQHLTLAELCAARGCQQSVEKGPVQGLDPLASQHWHGTGAVQQPRYERACCSENESILVSLFHLNRTGCCEAPSHSSGRRLRHLKSQTRGGAAWRARWVAGRPAKPPCAYPKTAVCCHAMICCTCILIPRRFDTKSCSLLLRNQAHLLRSRICDPNIFDIAALHPVPQYTAR